MAETLFLEQPNLSDLQTYGYVDVPHNFTDQEIAELNKSFDGICHTIRHEDPTGELQNSMEYKLDDSGCSKYYFEDKRAGFDNPIEPERGMMVDDKFVFHFGPLTLAKSVQYLRERGMALPSHFATFFEASREAYDKAMRAHRIGARILGLEDMFHKEGFERMHLRFLAYDPQTTTDQLADPHFDRSVTTLAIAESAPGLHGTPTHNAYRRPYSQQEQSDIQAQLIATPISHKQGVGKFFLGAGYERLRDVYDELPELPLLLHGVSRAHVSETEWRHAIILFGNPHMHHTEYIVPERPECKTIFDLAA